MTTFEREPLEKLSRDGELFTYKHRDFWQCMDTQRDMQQLNQLWNEGQARWKVWDGV
jgi:glucose-1-phosphate cytidylyltransferase